MKKQATRLIHNRVGGRLTPTVNPPIERASTVLLPDAEALYRDKPSYGLMGLGVHRELEAAMCDLEGGVAAHLVQNGLVACTLGMAACVKAGDHLLVADNIYGPARWFCEKRLPKMGVEVEYFKPRVGAGIADLIQDNTTAVYIESPGSLTFEICDTPAIVKAAHARGASVIMDNTWGAGHFHKPLELGVDISVQALTKYPIGHADAFAGSVVSRDDAHAKKVKSCAYDWGLMLGPDDAYTALRGLRTMPMRLAAHEAAALELAHWVAEQEEVETVLHPALEEFADHALWKRDFTGSCGLFGFVLKEEYSDRAEAFLDGFELFGFGFSWGGFESLLIPCDPQLHRSKSDTPKGPLMRIHVGLEDIGDLTADLNAAFQRMRA